MQYPYPVQPGQGKLKISQQSAQAIDHEVDAIVRATYQRALDLMRMHKSALQSLSSRLQSTQTLAETDFIQILGPKRTAPAATPESPAAPAPPASPAAPLVSAASPP
jgi:ATP-dependent Zn protease